MQHVERRRRRLAKQETQWGSGSGGGYGSASYARVSGRYMHPLQFYALPPDEEISLEEFEQLAVDRLRGGVVVGGSGTDFCRGGTGAGLH